MADRTAPVHGVRSQPQPEETRGGTVAGFFDVVRRQRACRAFAGDPVTDEVVAQVREAATCAPSAENRQPWVFVVVCDTVRRARIGDLARRAWEGGALSALLGLPVEVRPVAVVPLGRPARAMGPPRREPVAAKAHRERYGAGWS